MLRRAAIVMMCLVAGATAINRASSAEPVLLRRALDELPLAMANWRGASVARFDERTVQVLGVDDYVHRIYRRGPGEAVNLYIGFYGSQRHGDTMHSPLNCLPGSGWEPVARARPTVTVTAQDGTPREIAVNDFTIHRGEHRQVVLYWYQSRGRVEPNEYLSKVWTVLDAVRLNRTDGALVRVTTPIEAGETETARGRAVAFVQALFPHLGSHLPQ